MYISFYIFICLSIYTYLLGNERSCFSDLHAPTPRVYIYIYIYLFFYLSFYLSICLYLYKYIPICVHLSISLSFYLAFYLFTCVAADEALSCRRRAWRCIHIYLYIFLSMDTYLGIYISIDMK